MALAHRVKLAIPADPLSVAGLMSLLNVAVTFVFVGTDPASEAGTVTVTLGRIVSGTVPVDTGKSPIPKMGSLP